MKKLVALGTVVLVMGVTSVIAFASPSNPGVPARDGSGGRRNNAEYCRNCDGYGQNGEGRGLGIGGKMLQDGSCYMNN